MSPIDFLCLQLKAVSHFFSFSVWLWLIPPHSKQMYFASVALGYGGSTLLVTVLTMLADLIGNSVVRTNDLKFSVNKDAFHCWKFEE